MSYRKSTIDLLRDIANAMTFTVEIKSVTQNTDGTQTLSVCDIFHAQSDFTVTIDSYSYSITAIDANAKTITVKGTPTITATSFDLYKPYFFFGTPIQTGMELNKESEVNIEHTPMIYLAIPYQDKDSYDNSPITRQTTFDLYFLTKGSDGEWLNERLFDEGVFPMRRLMENFVQAIIDEVKTFDIIPASQISAPKDFPNFGVYLQGKGIPKRMWTDKLSGTMLHFDGIGVWDDGLCKDC